MLGSLRGTRTAILAAAMMGFGAMPVALSQPTIVQSAPRVTSNKKRSLFGGVVRSPAQYGSKGAGITMAQQKRTATKKRGIARNRRAHR